MISDEYNRRQIESGALTVSMVTEMVESWQRVAGLDIDGKCGPITQRSIERSIIGINPQSSSLGIAALEFAVAEVGNGEEGGNNSGPHVAKYHAIVDDGDPDDDGSWCAGFCSWIFEQAAAREGVNLPFRRSGGAKRLFKNIGTAGSFPSTPAPGDVVCWDRGKPGSWQGHIGIVEKVEDGILHTIEGNVGSFPSKVRRFMHDLTRQDRLEGFARAPSSAE